MKVLKLNFTFIFLVVFSSHLWSYSVFTAEQNKWGTPLFGEGASITYSFMSSGISLPCFGNSNPRCETVNMDFMPANFKVEIRRAFDAWSSVANLTFDEVVDYSEPMQTNVQRSGDIRIGANPIDGVSGILAYAYYPYAHTSSFIGGDIQFDSSEGSNWSTDGSGGFDVYLVTLHEIGHSLGLNHEASALAIMNPNYNGSLSGLQADDISGIQYIYGAAIPQAVPEPGTLGLMFLASMIFVIYSTQRRRKKQSEI